MRARPRLRAWTDILRITDLLPLKAEALNEEIVVCDLADRPGVLDLVADVDAVVHFGAIAVEDYFHRILQANIVGAYNVYEAVRKHGVKRVVFASSSQVTGFYRQAEVIGVNAPLRPSGFYGLSKCYGETLSRMYYDRFGIETVCVRIGSCFPEVRDRRMLATFLSYDDLAELVRCALMTPHVGHTIIYGVSNNASKWWDNAAAAHLGFAPKDSADNMRAQVEAAIAPPHSDDPTAVYQGGVYVQMGFFDE